MTEVINTARLIEMSAREVAKLVEMHGTNTVDEFRKRIGNDAKLKRKLYQNFIEETDNHAKIEEVYRGIPESDKPIFLNTYFWHSLWWAEDVPLLDEAVWYFKDGRLIPHVNWAIIDYLGIDGMSVIALSHPEVIHRFFGSCIQYGDTENREFCTNGRIIFPTWTYTRDHDRNKRGYLRGAVDLNAPPFRIQDLLSSNYVHPEADDKQLWELLRNYLWSFTPLVEFGASFDPLKLIEELNKFEGIHPKVMQELRGHNLFEKEPFSQITYDEKMWKWKRKSIKPQLKIVDGWKK